MGWSWMSEPIAPPEISAGGFSHWLSATFEGLRNGTGAEVPCGECKACCISSYFIHVESDETATLAAVGDDAIPAPGKPGDRLMGFDESGFCPKMENTGCSIYENRPRTCRIYDCRIFAAAGLDAGSEKPLINARIAQWRFLYRDENDRARHDAVKAAVVFIRDHAALFPGGRIPSDPGQLALLALKVHESMLPGQPSESNAARIARMVQLSRTFDSTSRPLSDFSSKP
jgi:Fe-S-cluster containining protein